MKANVEPLAVELPNDPQQRPFPPVWKWACQLRVHLLRHSVAPICLSFAAKLVSIGPLALHFSSMYVKSQDDHDSGAGDYSGKTVVDRVAWSIIVITFILLVPWAFSRVHSLWGRSRFVPLEKFTWNDMLQLHALSQDRFAIVSPIPLIVDVLAWLVIVGLCGDYTTKCALPETRNCWVHRCFATACFKLVAA